MRIFLSLIGSVDLEVEGKRDGVGLVESEGSDVDDGCGIDAEEFIDFRVDNLGVALDATRVLLYL